MTIALILLALCGAVRAKDRPVYEIEYIRFDDHVRYLPYKVTGPPKVIGQMAEDWMDFSCPGWRAVPFHSGVFVCQRAYEEGVLFMGPPLPGPDARIQLELILIRQRHELLKKLKGQKKK